MNTLQILTVKFQCDLMHWNVSIVPEKWPIFGRFLTLFPLKCPARREKNTSNMAATIGDVMDDVKCKSSIEKLGNFVRDKYQYHQTKSVKFFAPYIF
jgi:hypothetical protein